jgi:hypothetical protein
MVVLNWGVGREVGGVAWPTYICQSRKIFICEVCMRDESSVDEFVCGLFLGENGDHILLLHWSFHWILCVAASRGATFHKDSDGTCEA